MEMLEKLMDVSGGMKIVEKNNSSAVKVHFGEDGNLNFVSPLYVRKVVDLIKKSGGKPFLTDTTTLYSGRRFKADTHIELAKEHGFDFSPVVIADGFYGDEYEEINGAKIARLFTDIETMFCVSHFKGHLIVGFGGALKNLAMGCSSKGGKLEMHSKSKPYINMEKCTLCLKCFDYCAYKAISKKKSSVEINEKLCTGCGGCMSICPERAIKFKWDAACSDVQKGIAKYAASVTKDKKIFYINFLINISPNCDCFHTNEPMIAPDIGILASFDPVSIEQASYDMVKEPLDKLYPEIDPTEQIMYAEKFGAGERKYEIKLI
jgi:uncharacterized Fe-S center protein